jgi:hypothetical protein
VPEVVSPEVQRTDHSDLSTEDSGMNGALSLCSLYVFTAWFRIGGVLPFLVDGMFSTMLLELFLVAQR